MASPFTYALVAAEIVGMIVCLILLYGNEFETHQKTESGRMFSWMLLTNVAALLTDCLAWALDGNPANTVMLYICNSLSIIAALVLIAQYALYIFTYLSGRITVSKSFIRGILIFCTIVIGITVIACACGIMFTIEDGVYIIKPFYYVYSIFTLLAMIANFVVTTRCRKDLGVHDSIAAYIYIALPTCSALINLWVEEFAFTYIATTISALVLYVMIQSEQNSKLLHEKLLSSYYAQHDDMTGLLSRRAYIDKLEELAGSEGNVGVIFSDINGLKYTNDNYGHSRGDKLIMDFTELLKAHFRKDDIYRISGDEFIIIADMDDESAFYERVEAIEKAINTENSPIACLGAEFGCTYDVEKLIQQAENIMYIRKEEFHRLHPEMHRYQI